MEDDVRRDFANELWKKSAITIENLPDSRKYPIDTLEILLHPSKDESNKKAEIAPLRAEVKPTSCEIGASCAESPLRCCGL